MQPIKLKLQSFLGKKTVRNIADKLSKEQLQYLGDNCVRKYNSDQASMKEWLDNAEKIVDLASLKDEPGTRPWAGAANVKYPITATACTQFVARYSGELCKDNKLFRSKVIGADPDYKKCQQGDRVCTFLNYEFVDSPDADYLDLNDKMLCQLFLIGTIFKKTYIDPLTLKVKSEFIPYKDIVLDHANTRSLADATAITQYYELDLNSVQSRVISGLFLEPELFKTLEFKIVDSEDRMFPFIEQHMWADLDDDGYAEPYIVTVLLDGNEVLSIQPRFDEDGIRKTDEGDVYMIEPHHYFTDYHFLPNPDGGFFSVGFGTYLLANNKLVNTMFNLLTNSGVLHSMNCGVVAKDLQIEGGQIVVEPGRYVNAESASANDLGKSIMTLPTHEPSTVLFQMLGQLVDASKELTASTESLSGAADAQYTKPTALETIIEQGLTIHTAIQRRLFRKYKKEFQLIVDCYSKKAMLKSEQDKYVAILGEPASMMDDFNSKTFHIVPTADPNDTSIAEKARRNGQLIQLYPMSPPPVQQLLYGMLIKNSDLTEADKELVITTMQKASQQPPPPNIDMLKLQMESQMKAEELQIKLHEVRVNEKKVDMEHIWSQSEYIKNRADALKSIALADAANHNAGIAAYQTVLQKEELELRRQEMLNDSQDSASGLEGSTDNSSVS